MEDTVTFFAGLIFFTSSFTVIKSTIEYFFGQKLTKSDKWNISVKTVSALQAILCFVAGLVITSKCQKNLLNDQHWLTNGYAWFALPYFYYDLVVMFIAYCYQKPELMSKAQSYRIQHYIFNNKAMVIHHFLLPIIFFPVIVYLRKGVGDFFIGTFYMIELAVPFISIRNILVQLQMKNTAYYIIAGLMMILAFTICRVLVFPYLYWKYSFYAKTSIWEVPFRIPLKCNLGCILLLSLQLYYLLKMIRGAVKTLYKIHCRKVKI